MDGVWSVELGQEKFYGVLLPREMGFGIKIIEALGLQVLSPKARDMGVREVVIEGDCMALLSKLKNKMKLHLNVGVIVDGVFLLSNNFDLFTFHL